MTTTGSPGPSPSPPPEDRPSPAPPTIEEQAAAMGIPAQAIAIVKDLIHKEVTAALDADTDRFAKGVLASMQKQIAPANQDAGTGRTRAVETSPEQLPTGGAGQQQPPGRLNLANLDIQQIASLAQSVASIMQAFKGPSAAPAAAGELEKMASYVKAFGTMSNEMLTPFLSMYNQGGRDERERMTVLSKTGFDFDWNRQQPPPGASANGGGAGEGTATIARRLAGEIKVKAPISDETHP